MSIYCPPKLLKRFESLSESGFEIKWTTGTRVARGFADLGFEEFLFIEPNKLVSLFTGDRSEVSDADRAHFVVIPTIDFIADTIQEQGAKLSDIKCIDGREWELQLESAGEARVFKARSLWEVFSEALLYVIGGES